MQNRVEELRRLYGIRQEALAEAMEVSRQSIGSIENGRYNPSTALAIKIARYFGLRVEDVFFLEGNPSSLTVDMLCKMPENSLVMKNRLHNLDIPLPQDKPITGQGNRYPSQFSYATFTTAHNGAEPIALFNALLMGGAPMTFVDILTELEGNGLPLLEGYAGTDPKALMPFFQAHDIPMVLVENQSEFVEQIQEGDIFVMSFWNDRFFRELKGLRTVAGTIQNGAWVCYNMVNDTMDPRTYRTLPEALRGKKFISAYLWKR